MGVPGRWSWGRRIERWLAVIGVIAVGLAVFIGWRLLTLPDWLQPGDPPEQPKAPLSLTLDDVPKLIKFSIHGYGAPYRGPDFWFYILTDGSIVCDVADDKGGTTRHTGVITPEQTRILQRVIVRTDFMHLPTNQTVANIVCAPLWTFDLYFWDDTTPRIVRHYKGDTSHPELHMLEDAIWDAFDLDRWIQTKWPENR